MTKKSQPPTPVAAEPVYRLTLRASADGPPAIVRLRHFLKMALRAYGLKCLTAEQIADASDTRAQDAPFRSQVEGCGLDDCQCS